MSRIQVMLHHGFGDFLMAVPVIRSLSTHPKTILDIIVKNEEIASFGDKVLGNRNIHWFTVNSSIRRLASLAIQLRTSKPTKFLAIHAKGRKAGWLARATGAQIRVGPVRRYGYNRGVLQKDTFGFDSVYDEVRHKVYLYLDFVRAAGICVYQTMADVRLDVPETAQSSIVERYSFLKRRPVIGIAPSCGLGQHKKWTAQGFARVIEQLVADQKDLKIVIIGSCADRADGRAIISELPDRIVRRQVIDLIGATDLVDLLALMESFSLLLTICNGPSHLGAALGIPIVGIYGPTNPGFTGPFSDKLYVVRKGYRCSPCYRWELNEGCGTPRCMLDIEINEVLAACKKAMKGEPPDPIPSLSNTLARGFLA